ncbi:hypothetical protein CBR_g29671 [Chara braunii]|uniref:Uncharacterized protein n=1 Tax=Chara braunii TaxID=69332 RepID=A0A388LB65_CHABU|nr:hypothetical protein CBR_g29671 [Chara braunii]|eukprot:GBG79524.1 hypothetical protein CBR_g29671 [Chara braunii]
MLHDIGDVHRGVQPLYFGDPGEGSSGEGAQREEEEEEEGSQEGNDGENTITDRERRGWGQMLNPVQHDVGGRDSPGEEHYEDLEEHDEGWYGDKPQKETGEGSMQERRKQERRRSQEEGRREEITPSLIPAAVTKKKRKAREDRKKNLHQKRGKRQVLPMSMDEAVQSERDAAAAMRQKSERRKKAAKGGTMAKTAIFPPYEQQQSGDEAKGKTATRPSTLQLPSTEPVTSHLGKGYFLDFDADGTQKSTTQFITVDLAQILDLPDDEYRYNQRFLDENLVNDIYQAMVTSGEAAIRERKTGGMVLLLVALHDQLHTDPSGKVVRATRVTPDEFDETSLEQYFWYPISGQHNVAAARRCFRENQAVANELRLDTWTTKPVYYPDQFMDQYGTLNTFQNAKDKWNTPPHQSFVVRAIRKLWNASACPEAKGGQGAEEKNAAYRKFAGEALRTTGIQIYVDMSIQQPWSAAWSDALGPYMTLARASTDVYDAMMKVYAAWKRDHLPGRDAVKPATKLGEAGKAQKSYPGYEIVVIMSSNDGEYHRSIISLFEDIQLTQRSSSSQATDTLTLARRERKPKLLTDVREKNFQPTKRKSAGTEPKEKVVYEGMEREPNAMVEMLEHFCPADEAVMFHGKGHAALVWELLKSHRHCIVLESEDMKFDFLVQYLNTMVDTQKYPAKFIKPPPRHDEARDFVHKVGKNMANIWEFLFQIRPENRGDCTYNTRKRIVEALLRGYHKASSDKEIAFLDRLEVMYFNAQIGAFTVAAYTTCFPKGEHLNGDDSEEESVDGTLQAALASERQKVTPSSSQKMATIGTSSRTPSIGTSGVVPAGGMTLPVGTPPAGTAPLVAGMSSSAGMVSDPAAAFRVLFSVDASPEQTSPAFGYNWRIDEGDETGGKRGQGPSGGASGEGGEHPSGDEGGGDDGGCDKGGSGEGGGTSETPGYSHPTTGTLEGQAYRHHEGSVSGVGDHIDIRGLSQVKLSTAVEQVDEGCEGGQSVTTTLTGVTVTDNEWCDGSGASVFPVGEKGNIGSPQGHMWMSLDILPYGLGSQGRLRASLDETMYLAETEQQLEAHTPLDEKTLRGDLEIPAEFQSPISEEKAQRGYKEAGTVTGYQEEAMLAEEMEPRGEPNSPFDEDIPGSDFDTGTGGSQDSPIVFDTAGKNDTLEGLVTK